MRRFINTFAVALCASAAALAATDAPAITNNPIGAQYLATMPAAGDSGVYAQFAVMSGPAGDGALFTININGKVFSGGPFLYHIHDATVPSSGNCTATAAHLDPYARGETPGCDQSNPSSCQVGDLSGKHGTIPALPGFSANYSDKYVSLTPGTAAFLGNRSVVLHYANKTRIACANFQLVQKNSGSSSFGSNSSSPSGGFIGSSPTGSGVIGGSTPATTSPVATAGGPGATGASKSVPAGSATPSSTAASNAMGLKFQHRMILGPLLFGAAVMVL